jgi:hypothetical protein
MGTGSEVSCCRDLSSETDHGGSVLHCTGSAGVRGLNPLFSTGYDHW